jgi:hypothetical protein
MCDQPSSRSRGTTTWQASDEQNNWESRENLEIKDLVSQSSGELIHRQSSYDPLLACDLPVTRGFPSGFEVYPAGWRQENFTVVLRASFYPCPRLPETAILRFTMQKRIPANNVTLAANDSALKA